MGEGDERWGEESRERREERERERERIPESAGRREGGRSEPS